MRRTLILLLALLLVSAGLLTAGAGYLTGTEDDIELTHHLVAGDPAAAEGITLTLLAGEQGASQTCWETTVDLGTEELDPETTFTFYPGGKTWESTPQPYVEIYTGSTNFGMSSSSGIDFSEYTGEGVEDPGRYYDATMMVLPAADVAERTENGETRTETLRLADYYDYYPMAVELYLPDQEGRSRVYATWAECQALTDYFGMRVPENLMVEVSVTKDELGQVYNVETHDVGDQRFWFDCQAVVVEDGVCLSIAVMSEDMDVSEDLVACRDGFGLYFIPFSEELKTDYEQGDSVFDLDNVRMFCPLDQGSSPMLLNREEEGQLLLYAREDGALKLSVFDVETWQCVQWETIFSLGEEDYYSLLGSGDGFMVMSGPDNIFRVVEEQDGVYTPTLSGVQDTGDGYVDEWWYNVACAYDGQRLVLSGITASGDCSLWVQVYREEGLAYGARIDHSLDREDVWNPYEYSSDSVIEQYPIIAFTGA